VKVREVGRDLGVRYVLEGGVQRSGSRVRITAQLVDATTGYHIWAERYDREAGDIFAVQDEVTQQIVRALAVKLTDSEKARLGRAPTTGVVEAYDLVLRGHEQRRRTTREGNAEARRLFVRALDLDPTYAPAYAGLSWTHLQSWQFVWTTDRDSLERARELAERAIALNDTLVDAYRLLGQVYLWQKQHDRAIAQAERAVSLAPNDADGYETLAEILGWSGRAEESIKLIRQAMRLNPHHPIFYVWTLGHAYYLTERRPQALEALNTIVKENPNFLPAHAYRAVLLTELGRTREAGEAWAKASQISPDASMANVRERLPYRRASDVDRFLTGMHRVAGP
jgi:nitroreductase